MAHVRTKYIVYNHSGGGVRHHHFTSSNNITSETNDNYPGTTNASPGSHTANGWGSLPFGGFNLPFAFMSVHGAADGNHLYTSPGNQIFPVGSADVDVLVVYAPQGGIGGPGGPGVWVDAFNVDTGDFSDDLHFITILTPPTPPDNIDTAKTTFANQEGEVSSLTAEHIRASATIDGGVPFVEWKRIIPVETISTEADFNLAANETGEIWFAFYQRVPPSRDIVSIIDRIEYSLGKWVIDDYCGTPWPHPVGPPGPAFRINIDDRIIKTLPPEQQKMLKTYMDQYPAAAQSAYNQMKNATGILKNVASVLTKANAVK